jgi:hypothetical protein
MACVGLNFFSSSLSLSLSSTVNLIGLRGPPVAVDGVAGTADVAGVAAMQGRFGFFFLNWPRPDGAAFFLKKIG